MDYIATIRQFIVENFLFGDDGGLGEETSFMESGIIDSTGILEVVSFLEETYGITPEDDELLPENLDSLKNLDGFIRRKIAQLSVGDSTEGQAVSM